MSCPEVLDTCSICYGALKTSNTHPESDDSETPMQLYCGHIFGAVCLQDWLSTHSKNIDCPTCRRAQFHKCKHVCQARSLLAATKIPPMPKNMILEKQCINCYMDTPGCAAIINASPILKAKHKDVLRRLGVEILTGMGRWNWKGLEAGTWEAVLTQLVFLLRTKLSKEEIDKISVFCERKANCMKEINSILEERNEQICLYGPAFNLTAEAEEFRERMEDRIEQIKRIEALEIAADWRSKTQMLVTIFEDGEVDFGSFAKAWDGEKVLDGWDGENVVAGKFDLEKLEGLRQEIRDAWVEGKDTFVKKAMEERW